MPRNLGGLVALVIANLFVAFQTLRYEWGFYEVMLVFWVEVVILGCYNVLRLLAVGVLGDQPFGSWAAHRVDLGSRLNRLALTAIGIGFFAVKFGGFALVVGLFVLLLPALLTPEDSDSARNVHQALRTVGPGFFAAAGALALSHGVSFVQNFLLGREYQRLNALALAFWPYARMSLVAAILLLGIAVARLLPGLGSKAVFAGVMVLLKLGADVVSHVVEHRWLATEPVLGGPS